VSNTCWTLFESEHLWKEAINHIAVFGTNNVILKGIRYKKIGELSFQFVD